MASRLVRTNTVTVNEVLDGHTLMEIDCVDRVYLSMTVPSLVVGGQVVSFLTQHLGKPIPSPSVLDQRGQQFRRAVASFAETNQIPVITFAGRKDKTRPGVLADNPWPERKIDKVMPLIRRAAATGRSQVVAIGMAQEFQRVFTGTKSETGTGAVWFSYHRTERRVTSYYFYLWDADFGPAFVKICAYFPYPGKIWFNGHEWAKRQAIKAGLAFTELSNGFASCADPAALQAICDRLGPGAITVFAERWWARLPLPFTTTDREAGYWWEISMRQIEIAKTLVLTAPRYARAFLPSPGRRQPRSRPSGQHGDHLQPADPLHHPRCLSHRDRPRQRRRRDQRLLPALPDQVLPQRRPRPAHRDRHQRHLRPGRSAPHRALRGVEGQSR